MTRILVVPLDGSPLAERALPYALSLAAAQHSRLVLLRVALVNAPMTIDMSTGFHFRPEGLGFLMAWNDPDETPGFKTVVDRAFVEKVLTLAVRRVPVRPGGCVGHRVWPPSDVGRPTRQVPRRGGSQGATGQRNGCGRTVGRRRLRMAAL